MTHRLYLVTFDIPGGRPGDSRYRRVDSFLHVLGSVHKPLKQVRLIVTGVPPRVISAGVRSRIGMRGNITVLRVGRYSIVDCFDPAVARAVRRLFRRYGR